MSSVKTDGRDINTSLGILTGEAALQKAKGKGDQHEIEKARTWTGLPEPRLDEPTYYDRPLLQESVWTWAIPTYYYFGGLSGACGAFGAALQISNAACDQETIRYCHWMAAGAAIVSGGLLVYDLGRPMRFLNMLRVFRPTSPMNMGAWILTFAGGPGTIAALVPGTLVGRVTGLASGFFGLGLATYTGVLVGNTAVPLWSASRVSLPLLFGASAVTAAGSALDLFHHTPATRLFGDIGRACELAASFAMEKEAGQIEYVARPLHRGFSGVLWRSAAILTGTSLVCSLIGRKNRTMRFAAGVLGTLGSLTTRFAVEHAGNKSARDPQATFRQQRQNPAVRQLS
jgi:hypothetical protein